MRQKELEIWRPFEEAREWARSLGFRRKKDWDKYKKIKDFPNDILKDPKGYRGAIG